MWRCRQYLVNLCSPLRPRLVVSRSTCPPLSPSPHANSFVIDTAVINTHTLNVDFASRMSTSRDHDGASVGMRGERPGLCHGLGLRDGAPVRVQRWSGSRPVLLRKSARNRCRPVSPCGCTHTTSGSQNAHPHGVDVIELESFFDCQQTPLLILCNSTSSSKTLAYRIAVTIY